MTYKTGRHPSRIHWQIRPHQPHTRRMGLLLDWEGCVRYTPICKSRKWFANQAPCWRQLLPSPKHTRSMAAQVVAINVQTSYQRLWYWIRWWETCASPPHLIGKILRGHHQLTWKKYAGIDLSWEYAKFTCLFTMKIYIYKVLFNSGHTKPTKRQLLPHKHQPTTYGEKSQIAPSEYTILKINENGIKLFQGLLVPSWITQELLTIKLSWH